MLRMRREGVRQPDHGLGGAEHDRASRVEGAGEAAQHVGLRGGVEIDQHVAAEDDVEGAELGEALEQVELPELDHGADRRRELPVVAGLGEVLQEKRDRQAALDLELAVESAPRPLEHLA